MEEDMLKKNTLYEIYVDENLENFFVGEIIDSDNINTIFKSYDTLGFYDGVRIIKTKEIVETKDETPYLDDIKKLINENSKENIKNSYIIHTEELISEKFSKLNDVYTYLFNNEIEVSIDLKDSIVTGLINKIEDEFLLVDGNKIYKKDILYISTNTEEQRTYKFLGVEAYE